RRRPSRIRPGKARAWPRRLFEPAGRTASRTSGCLESASETADPSTSVRIAAQWSGRVPARHCSSTSWRQAPRRPGCCGWTSWFGYPYLLMYRDTGPKRHEERPLAIGMGPSVTMRSDLQDKDFPDRILPDARRYCGGHPLAYFDFEIM